MTDRAALDVSSWKGLSESEKGRLVAGILESRGLLLCGPCDLQVGYLAGGMLGLIMAFGNPGERTYTHYTALYWPFRSDPEPSRRRDTRPSSGP